MYYRKISDNQFITTNIDYYSNYNDNIDIFDLRNKKQYFIYGLYSGSVYIPVESNDDDPKSIYIQRQYFYNLPVNIALKNIYLLSEYIYLDREERLRFYQGKHDYIIDQLWFSGDRPLNNLNNKINLELINPCKYIVFMAQVKYFTNSNVNDFFNYNTLFFNGQPDNIDITQPVKTFGGFPWDNTKLFSQKTVIKTIEFLLQSNSVTSELDMSYYNLVVPFFNYQKAQIPSGFGLHTFCLYSNIIQPSGSCNMSCFNTISINTTLNPIDVDYNNYLFKAFGVSHNVFRVVHGVAGVVFKSSF